MSFSPEHYAGFLKRMGHTVREIDGVRWFNTARGVYTCFPFHRDIDAPTIRLREILGRDGVVARFGCPEHQGVSSFRILCDDSDYDFPSLRKRTRTQVRRGLEACRIAPVDFADLGQHAIPLNADTLIRQGRKVPANLEHYWTNYFAEAARTEGAEAWAAFVDGDMAAYLISFMIEDVSNLLILRSSLKHLKAFPNNALVFQFLSHKMQSPDCSQVVYGYESIQAGLGSLDQFKTGMGFRLAPVGQRVELSPWIAPLVNRFTIPAASGILKRLGSGENNAKLRGILSWYAGQPQLAAADIARAA
jgi:hypothetical protein